MIIRFTFKNPCFTYAVYGGYCEIINDSDETKLTLLVSSFT